MTKIVYSSCFGGFGLSHEAIVHYAALSNRSLTWEDDDEFGHYRVYSLDGRQFSDHEIPRNDPTLARVVEELGEAASGPHVNLQIRELPSGTKYRIDEYDGNESVITLEEYEWETA